MVENTQQASVAEMNFLEELAQTIFDQYEGKLQQLKIVFPNRRAGLFFQSYLSKLASKPIWSPTIFSMEDFVSSLTDKTLADQITLVFELYRSFSRFQSKEEGFDKFYYWGEMLLRDFDDVDKYMVNAEHLFKGVKSQKELDEAFFFMDEDNKKILQEFWANFLPDASPNQNNFLKTWEVLHQVYADFKQRLERNKIGYSGSLYRTVAENIGDCTPGEYQVIFTGFNALTKTEEIIIKHYVDQHKAEVYWDYDQYYFGDKFQEAGSFLRQYASDKVLGKTFPRTGPENFRKDKDIHAIGVSLEIGQAKATGELLNNYAKELHFRPERTVVVLPHEHMLFPVLNSIPQNIEDLNVTMGYPLRDSPLYGLLESVISLQDTSRLEQNHFVLFYHKPVLEILAHPYLFQAYPDAVNEIMVDVKKRNKVVIYKEELATEIALINQIFQKIEPKDLLEYLLGIVRSLFRYTNEILGLEKEFLYQFHQSLERLKEILLLQDTAIDLKTFTKLFRQVCRSQSIPFTGEPLRGLQIMGVLETRNLDFDNVIILSMNEGSFPAEIKKGSFIPYNIRRAFDLPTYQHQDAIYAYLFYRLIQRAKNVHFLYNTHAEFGLSGEISRFVSQLEVESGIPVKKHVLSNPVKVTSPESVGVEKTPEIERILADFLAGGRRRLTPSALNTYLDCRLRFYYRYVLKYYEEDDVQEEIDPAMFGNILHKAMEELYKDARKKKKSNIIEPMDFFMLEGSITGALQAAFKDYYHLSKHQKFKIEGRNIVIWEIMEDFMKSVLKHDQTYAPFEVVSLEGSSRDGYKMDFDLDDGRKVGLKGIIDRIDKKEGKVRVLDYKSGSDKKEFASLEKLFDRSEKRRNKAAFQTFYYGMLYANLHGEDLPIKPGIYNMLELFKPDFDISITEKKAGTIEDMRSYLATYKGHLKGLLEEIFAEDTVFDQTDDLKKCGYCEFSVLCKR